MGFFKNDPELQIAAQELEVAKAEVQRSFMLDSSVIKGVEVDKALMPVENDQLRFRQLFVFVAKSILSEDYRYDLTKQLSFKYFPLLTDRVKFINLISYPYRMNKKFERSFRVFVRKIIRADKVKLLYLPSVAFSMKRMVRLLPHLRRLEYLQMVVGESETFKVILQTQLQSKLVLKCNCRIFEDISNNNLIAALAVREDKNFHLYLKVELRYNQKLKCNRIFMKHYLTKMFKYYNSDENVKFSLGSDLAMVHLGDVLCELIQRFGQLSVVEYL